MLNRRLFTAAATAVLFSCFISAALSACGNGSSYSDMGESEPYHVLDYSYGSTEESTVTVPVTDNNATEGIVIPVDANRHTETVQPGTIPNATEEFTEDSQSAPTDGASLSASGDKSTGSKETSPSAKDNTTASPAATVDGTGSTEAQSSEAFQVQNPIQPIDHSVEFFFKVPGYTGKSYYDLYLNDGFVPIDGIDKLKEHCQNDILTLANGKKSVNYIITPHGLFDKIAEELAALDEKAASGKSITDVYERDAYLYERLGLDYQIYYSRGLAIFKIKKMGDVGSGKHSIYAIYYYSYEDAGQAEQVDDIVSRAVSGFGGSDYEKILAAYDYLCARAVYDNQGDSYEPHSAYGALVSGRAVCEGYAKAYKLLLDKMGISNYIVINSTHAWNVVLYNGEWYFVDVTNGDFNSCYAYFMLGGDVLCNEADLLVDSYIFSSAAIAYYGYNDGSNTDKNTLAGSSVSERNIVYR